MTDEDLDALMSRVTDRTATPDDWETIDCRAAGRPDVWAQLADLLRDDAHVREVVDQAAERACLLVPELAARPRFPIRRTFVAASVLVLMCGSFLAGRGSVATAPSASGPPPQLTSAEAFAVYVHQGVAEETVLGELPPVVLTARRAGESDDVEVVSVRRILERRITDEIMQVVTDEHGRPQRAPAELASFIPTESF